MGMAAFVEDSHDHLLAVDGGHGADAEVDALVPGLQGDGAVLGMRFSAMSILARILNRETIETNSTAAAGAARGARRPRGAGTCTILERLEVDVAGADAQGLLQDLVDHPDDPAVGAGRRRRVELENAFVLRLSRELLGGVAIVVVGDELGASRQ